MISQRDLVLSVFSPAFSHNKTGLYASIAQLARAADQLAEFTMLNSKQKGNLTELQCLTAFTELGYTVSIPYGDCAKYDFIADINNKLYRIQCKTSSEQDVGVYKFATRSTQVGTTSTNVRTYTEEDIDFFATIIDGKCYLVPITEVSGKQKTLRFIPPKNGQKEGIAYAKDYELVSQLEKLKE